MSKKIKIIFTLSFLLNIVLMGVLLGSLYKAHNRHHSFPHNQHIQEVMKGNMQQNRAYMDSNFKKIKGYKDELKSIITAEEFNQSAFEEKMNQILALKNVIAERKAQTLSKTLSELSREEREEFSGFVLDHLIDKRHGKKKGHNYMNKKEKLEN